MKIKDCNQYWIENKTDEYMRLRGERRIYSKINSVDLIERIKYENPLLKQRISLWLYFPGKS